MYVWNLHVLLHKRLCTVSIHILLRRANTKTTTLLFVTSYWKYTEEENYMKRMCCVQWHMLCVPVYLTGGLVATWYGAQWWIIELQVHLCVFCVVPHWYCTDTGQACAFTEDSLMNNIFRYMQPCFLAWKSIQDFFFLCETIILSLWRQDRHSPMMSCILIGKIFIGMLRIRNKFKDSMAARTIT